MNPFEKLAGNIIDSLDKKAPESEFHANIRRMILEKNRKLMCSLHPAGDPDEKTREYFISKAAKCLMILTVGVIFSILICLRDMNENDVTVQSLPRSESSKGSYEHTLDLYADGKEYKNVSIHVSERKYSNEELEGMLPEFHQALEKTFIGDNSDASDISLPLDPVGSLPGYPFDVEWEYSDRSSIDSNGNIRLTPDPAGTLLEVTAVISYEDFRERYIFPIMIVPKAAGNLDTLTAVTERIEAEDKESRLSDSLTLPAEQNGITLIWTEPKKHSALILFLMSIATSVFLFIAGDHDLTKKMKEREEEMLLDYPDIISKMVLYAGAGMTVRSAWKKIATESELSASHHAYKEMLVTVRELERGEGELTAYRHFASRCGIRQYVKFASLLEQNIKLGASGFLMSLRAEAARAEEDRKASVKRRGEEAGTKLLLPMLMQLSIVMTVIIVPAFTGI